MLRLPWFEHRAPRSVAEAAKILAGEGPRAMLIAGGTDLLPNMKRRHQSPQVLVSVRQIPELRKLNGTFGAGLTLNEVARHEKTPTALRQAAVQVATPHLRNMGTLGGNLCLDTRCNYYNQTYEWRKAIDFCLKKDGKICWVATASKRCVAVSSTDTAPALIALDAAVTLVSSGGEREVKVADLFKNDGIEYLSRRPDEILTEVKVPAGWKSTYWKLRRRGSFDFPILGVAAALRFNSSNEIEEARLALGAVASRPFLVEKASEFLRGKKLTDEVITEASELVANRAKPMDNTDMDLYWRKEVADDFAGYALRELRGDDMRETRLRIARQPACSPAGRVEAEAEDGVRDDALQPGGVGPRRAARGNPGAHPRLHQEERGRHAADADDQRGPERRLADPVEAPDRQQHGGEGDAGGVVGGPADQALAFHGRRGGDAIMAEAALRHMAEPAADEAVVRCRNAEQPLAGEGPDIHYHRCAGAGQGSIRQEVHVRLLSRTVQVQADLRSRWTSRK
jgi:4-hydroxybenzoyl-CoA reductase subunit beta